MITIFNDTADRYTIGHTPANLRGREILSALADHSKVISKRAFSISICGGRGEVQMRFRGGQWEQSVHSCDKVFGFIRGRWSKV